MNKNHPFCGNYYCAGDCEDEFDDNIPSQAPRDLLEVLRVELSLALAQPQPAPKGVSNDAK